MAGSSIKLVFNRFPATRREDVRQADEVCGDIADEVLAKAKLLIQTGPKTGRIYKRGNVTHQASAPGQSPATDTGNLVNDSEVKKVGTADYEVRFNAEYAEALEFGTAKVQPRPFLRKAVRAYRKEFRERLKGVIG